MKHWLVALSMVCAFDVQALELKGEMAQGSLIRGQVAQTDQVFLNGKKLNVSPQGNFIFGISRDYSGKVTLKIQNGENIKEQTYPVAARDWDIQRIEGLPANKVTPNDKELKRIRAENKLIKAARDRDTAEILGDLFGENAFVWPAQGRISGIFGSQRILNGEPRSPHKGVDVAAPTGTPVVATADGMVSLTHQDMFYMGKTVMIDHGFGLSSIYIHLDSIAVEQGQKVAQGEELGTIGMTGRATGPHLHWGMSWYHVAIDPATLVPPMTAQVTSQ